MTTSRELWTDVWRDHATGAVQPRRRNAHREQALLKAILKVVRLHPRVAWIMRMNSGAYLTTEGRFVRFGFPGCPDLVGMLKDGRFVGIEVKTEDGRLTDDQRAVLETISANHGVAGCVRSIDDALAILDAS